MIKTYNLVRRHISDPLAEIVVSYIMPKCISYIPELIGSGAGELIEMFHPLYYDGIYEELIQSNDLALAELILKLDGGKTISEDMIREYAQTAKDDELVRAVYANDFDGVLAAIRSGARKFGVYPNTRTPDCDWKIFTLLDRCTKRVDTGNGYFAYRTVSEEVLAGILKEYETLA